MADPPQTAPAVKPANPNFSSGPCSKRPGWTIDALAGALTGRSHRAKPAKARIQQAIDLTRELLQVPADYRIGIVPASDTGAVEMFLWSALGARGVDMLAWESFGAGWVTDVQKQLKLEDVRVLDAPYGELPDLTQVDFTRDTTDGTLRGQRVAIFFNSVTTEDAIAADVTYNGSVQVVGGDPATTLSGAISAPDTGFLVDASANNITGTIEVYEDVNGTPTLVATLPFTATLNTNGTFSGALEDAANNLDGGFAGALSGPDREEVFIIFSISGNADGNDSPDDRRYVGSFIGQP